jgi:hypothetical protein
MKHGWHINKVRLAMGAGVLFFKFLKIDKGYY